MNKDYILLKIQRQINWLHFISQSHIILTLTLLEPEVISLCHQFRAWTRVAKANQFQFQQDKGWKNINYKYCT